MIDYIATLNGIFTQVTTKKCYITTTSIYIIIITTGVYETD